MPLNDRNLSDALLPHSELPKIYSRSYWYKRLVKLTNRFFIHLYQDLYKKSVEITCARIYSQTSSYLRCSLFSARVWYKDALLSSGEGSPWVTNTSLCNTIQIFCQSRSESIPYTRWQGQRRPTFGTHVFSIRHGGNTCPMPLVRYDFNA